MRFLVVSEMTFLLAILTHYLALAINIDLIDLLSINGINFVQLVFSRLKDVLFRRLCLLFIGIHKYNYGTKKYLSTIHLLPIYTPHHEILLLSFVYTR
jgi:hypothetical protein